MMYCNKVKLLCLCVQHIIVNILHSNSLYAWNTKKIAV